LGTKDSLVLTREEREKEEYISAVMRERRGKRDKKKKALD